MYRNFKYTIHSSFQFTSAEHAAKVLSYIESAVSEGAVVECGGGRVELQGECKGGWFLAPTVLTSCTDNMKAVREINISCHAHYKYVLKVIRVVGRFKKQKDVDAVKLM